MVCVAFVTTVILLPSMLCWSVRASLFHQMSVSEESIRKLKISWWAQIMIMKICSMMLHGIMIIKICSMMLYRRFLGWFPWEPDFII